MPDSCYDWEPELNATLDVSDLACNDVFDAHDVGLCAGPFQVQEPISSERPNFQYEPAWTIDNSFNPAPDFGSSASGQLSSLDVNFAFDSNLDHGSQNPLFHFLDQPHSTGNIPLANNINPLPMPGGLTDFDLRALPLPSFSPSATFGGLLPSVPSLGSIPTQSTSPNMMSQATNQPSNRLPLPPGGKSSFRCSVCASTFALRAQLKYLSPSGIQPFAHANFGILDAMQKTTKPQHVTSEIARRRSRSPKIYAVIRIAFMPVNRQHRFHCRHVTNAVTRLDDPIISSGIRTLISRTWRIGQGKGREIERECWQKWHFVWNDDMCKGFCSALIDKLGLRSDFMVMV